MLRRILAFLLFATPAFAAPPGWKYFVGGGATPCATIQTLDAAYCTALGCDGVSTKFWFPITVLSTGVCAVQIMPGSGYQDVSLTLPPSAKFPAGITVTIAQIIANQGSNVGTIQTRASLAGTLPGTLTIAQFEAILTTPQVNALNNANLQTTHPQVFNDWQAVQAAGYVDTQDPQFLDLANQALTAGLITQAEFNAMTVVTATAQGP